MSINKIGSMLQNKKKTEHVVNYDNTYVNKLDNMTLNEIVFQMFRRVIWKQLRRFLGCLTGLLVPFGDLLGHWRCLRTVLEASLEVLRRLGAVLEAKWTHIAFGLGNLWHLGSLLGRLGPKHAANMAPSLQPKRN